MEITNLRLWTDYPFQEGTMEVPARGSSLPPNQITVYDTFHVPYESWLSELRVSGNYFTFQNANYIAFNAKSADGFNQDFYGWVDSVDMVADTTEPVVSISWHPDLWRMWIDEAVVGSGMVVRRPEGGEYPPQPQPYLFRRASHITGLVQESNPGIWWVLMKIVFNVPVVNITLADTCTFPVDVNNPSRFLYVKGEYTINSSGNVKTLKCPSLDAIVGGLMEDMFELAPEAIVSVFLSPIAPAIFTGSGTENDPFHATDWFAGNGKEDALGGYLYRFKYHAFTEYDKTFSSVKTTDVNTYLVTGFDGETIGALPWGIEVNHCTSRIVMDTNSAYIQLRFGGINSNADGLCFNIPLPPLEITQNAYGSYAWTGMRSADIQQRATQAYQGLMTGLVGAATGGIGNVALGYLLAGDKPKQMTIESLPERFRTPANYNRIMQHNLENMRQYQGKIDQYKSFGAVNAVSGIASSVAGFAINRLTDGMVQRSIDNKYAAQPNGMAMAGTGYDALGYGRIPSLVVSRMDGYSQIQRQKDIDLYGVSVEEPTESCDSLVDGTGPLQIANAVVKGNIPAYARDYIKTRLAYGVIRK